MVGICDTDVRRRIGRDVRYDIVVDLVVIGIQTQVDADIRVQRLEVLYRLIIDPGLIDIGIVLRSEGYLELT
jgi:hypothetical protein